MIEVLCTVVILSLVSVFVMRAFLTAIRVSAYERDYARALTILDSQLDVLAAGDLSGRFDGWDKNAGDERFRVSRTLRDPPPGRQWEGISPLELTVEWSRKMKRRSISINPLIPEGEIAQDNGE